MNESFGNIFHYISYFCKQECQALKIFQTQLGLLISIFWSIEKYFFKNYKLFFH